MARSTCLSLPIENGDEYSKLGTDARPNAKKRRGIVALIIAEMLKFRPPTVMELAQLQQ
jgi:hypothetical protein